jgi:hypothetical protein
MNGGTVRARPPLQSALREALGAQPEALPIITEQFEAGAGAVAEDIDRPIQRILRETLPAPGG